MMTIREWKNEMNELVNDFQFATDIEKLRELLAAAEEIANNR